jgi:HD-GYP domain-containing protein (c-di-GMP phosphodiesterase class II)
LDEKPRVTRPFLAYVAVVIVSAAGVFSYSWQLYPPQLSVRLALLALAVLLSENYAFSIEPYSISLAFPLAMAGAVLGGPTWGCVIAGLSFTNLQEIRDRKPAPLVLFNLGQLVLSMGIAALTYARLGGVFLQSPAGVFQGWSRLDFPAMLVPMAAAALVCVSANMLLTATAMGVLTHRPVTATVATMIGFVPTQIALAFVGYLIAETLAINALALPLFVAPLIVARQLYMRYADMKVAFVDTVRSLVGALEAKDPYTRGHSERVSQYAARLGHAHGLAPKEIERLEYAALLHDLGKLAVPGSILVKPGRLEECEMDQIREHPGRGSEMISKIPPLRDLAIAVAQHHEWFDGGGYPNHLGGSDLGVAGRILAVADAFDAMTSTRAYRPARTREEAVAELINRAGSQFDPEVVRLFIEARVALATTVSEQTSDSPSMPESTAVGIGG